VIDRKDFKMKYLTAPLGYDMLGEPVAVNDTGGLRIVAHAMVSEERKDFHDKVDSMTLTELQKFFKDNGHTFE
jgi:hypothetical protein